MSDQPENLFLRRLEAKMDGLVQDITNLKHRITAVETRLGGMASTGQSHYPSLAPRLDVAVVVSPPEHKLKLRRV
jgi:hypothetical protein